MGKVSYNGKLEEGKFYVVSLPDREGVVEAFVRRISPNGRYVLLGNQWYSVNAVNIGDDLGDKSYIYGKKQKED